MLALILSPIGRYVGIGLAVSVALWWGYAHVKGIGYAECKSEWNAANVKVIEDGSAARRDGDSDAARGVPDGFDRDQ